MVSDREDVEADVQRFYGNRSWTPRCLIAYPSAAMASLILPAPVCQGARTSFATEDTKETEKKNN
jgi:hypothetical protein